MNRPAPPRIGLGWDRHRLEPGRPCILAGLEIESPVGPAAHSDGDALLHAVTDALLGAAGEPDLGTLFPDTDPAWKDAPSQRFLEEAMRRLHARGLEPWSVDLVLVCDRPRIAPCRDRLRAALADLLHLPVDRVNLKGKSTEGGPGAERIEVTAVVLAGPTG